ncbi:Dirigent protein - like 10 [Theobroma cacao]|uniref:Dirigent protein n=1 Tax=Theobroma cacao TaxID=3641 RepID=A0A061G4V8_THECC|nr:Disease resistance-responsive (dirigent-like protein) family protein, putative [Theobroma cacao]WRX19129.1 Dirigent protein - like 10 [Theobroma cacao]
MGAPPQKSYLCILFFTLFLVSQSVLATRKTLKQRQPCTRFSLYYHDNRFSGDDVANATSIAVLNATAFGNYNYGMLVIFDDPMTKDNSFFSPPAARAQGFYFYDGKTQYNAWFAFTLVFNSTEYKRLLA